MGGRKKIIEKIHDKDEYLNKNRPSDALFYDLNYLAKRFQIKKESMNSSDMKSFSRYLKEFIDKCEKIECYSGETSKKICWPNICLFMNSQEWITELEWERIDCLCDYLWAIHEGEEPNIRQQADIMNNVIDTKGRSKLNYQSKRKNNFSLRKKYRLH